MGGKHWTIDDISQDSVDALGKNRFGWKQQPTANGSLYWLGWNIQTDTGQALASGSPITMSEPAYNSHIILNISVASGLPFTVRLTGTSVDESTGVETPSDTEDLNVTANGYYQSTKSWITAIQVSIVEATKSCTIDIYRCTYWDRGNINFKVVGCRLEWTPDTVFWDIRLKIDKVNNDGDLINIDDTTFTNTDTPSRAEREKPGKYKRGNYNTSILGAQKEGIIVWINQTGIGEFYLEVKYE